MDFFERLAITKWMLQRQGRISYAMLKREFGPDDDTLENLRYELIIGQQLVADEDGEGLVGRVVMSHRRRRAPRSPKRNRFRRPRLIVANSPLVVPTF